MKKPAVFGSLLLAALAACSPAGPSPGGTAMKPKFDPKCVDCDTPAVAAEKLPASESEWKAKHTPEQFYILR